MALQYSAAVLHAAQTPMSIETIKAGELRPNDVLVRIRAVGLCHTDLEVIEGTLRNPLPIVLGHEAAGIVEQVGPPRGASRPAIMSCCPGIRIAAIASTATAARRSCASNISAKGRTASIRRRKPCHAGRRPAGAAFDVLGRVRRILHRVRHSRRFAVPKEIPFDRACLIGCGVMTGVGAALNLAAIAHGDTVMVIGCGAVGLAAVQGARLAGARDHRGRLDPASCAGGAAGRHRMAMNAPKEDAVAAGSALDQRPRRRCGARGGRQRVGLSGDHRGGAAGRPDHLARQDRRRQGRRVSLGLADAGKTHPPRAAMVARGRAAIFRCWRAPISTAA